MDLISLSSCVSQEHAREVVQKWEDLKEKEGVKIVLDDSLMMDLRHVVKEDQEPLIYMNTRRKVTEMSGKCVEILENHFDGRQLQGLRGAELEASEDTYKVYHDEIMTNGRQIGHYALFHEYDAWFVAVLAIRHEDEVDYGKQNLVTKEYAAHITLQGFGR